MELIEDFCSQHTLRLIVYCTVACRARVDPKPILLTLLGRLEIGVSIRYSMGSIELHLYTYLYCLKVESIFGPSQIYYSALSQQSC